MSSTQIKIIKDLNSTPTYITAFSVETKSILLSANIAASIPVPADALYAVLYYDTGKDVFVRADADPVRPVNDTPVSTAGVLLKPSVIVQGFTTLNFICGESAMVCVEFYR